MKKTICLIVLLLTGQLSASTIPQYQIISINGSVVTFSNHAVLNALDTSFGSLIGWHVGDFVELASMTGGLFGCSPLKRVDGSFVFTSTFLLNNLTQNDKRASACLRQPPIFPLPGTFIITDIDHNNQMITLSDSTIWTYPTHDQSNEMVKFWDIGDIIMIGVDNLQSVFPEYDAILINTRTQNIIKAIEQ